MAGEPLTLLPPSLGSKLPYQFYEAQPGQIYYQYGVNLVLLPVSTSAPLPSPPSSLSPFFHLLLPLPLHSLLSSFSFSLSPLSLYHRTAYPNMFEVHTRDRIFLLSAPTDEEMQSWVGMLQTLKQYDRQRHFTRRNCPTSLQNSPLGPPSDRQSPTRRRVASDTDSERKSAQVKEGSVGEAEKEEDVLNGRRKSGLRTKHG